MKQSEQIQKLKDRVHSLQMALEQEKIKADKRQKKLVKSQQKLAGTSDDEKKLVDSSESKVARIEQRKRFVMKDYEKLIAKIAAVEAKEAEVKAQLAEAKKRAKEYEDRKFAMFGRLVAKQLAATSIDDLDVLYSYVKEHPLKAVPWRPFSSIFVDKDEDGKLQ